MSTVIAHGEEFDVIWDGAHGGQGLDLFRRHDAPMVYAIREEKKRGPKPRAVETRACVTCGAAVLVHNRLALRERDRRRFCSRKCAQLRVEQDRRLALAQVAA